MDELRRRWVPLLLLSVVAAVGTGAATYWGASQYFLDRAEHSLRDLLLSHRGIHLYIQKTMHPALYDMKDGGAVAESFYAPELFSSTFMVRGQHEYFNQARRDVGLPDVYYKMAAANPRNPVNRADTQEAELIQWFNQHREATSFRDVVEQDGRRFLYYAIPFLQNGPACLRCHGKREDAPQDLQRRYPGPGGFNESLGTIRAIESVRVPIEMEYRAAWGLSAALLAGLAALAGMALVTRWLQQQVRDRSRSLVQESAERRRAEEALRFTHFAVNSIPDATFWVRRDNSLRDINQAACQALGYSREELLTLGIQDFDPAFTPARAELLWERCRRDGSARVSTRYRRKDGSTYPVEIMVAHTTFSGHEYLLGVSRDVSDRERLEAELLQAQKMEAIGTLAGGIAHDFNNILTGVLSYAEITLGELPPESSARGNVQEILAAARRARELVKHILTFSRRDQRQRQPLHVASVAGEGLKLLRASIPTTVEIKTCLDAAAWVLADPTGFHQVVMNLCTNANHAMRATGGTMSVEVAPVSVQRGSPEADLGVRPGPWVRLRVQDTGHGMDAATRARIFEPYFSSKPVGEGTGLGLPVVLGIVTSWGGTITVESQPGQGATFDVYLLPAPPQVATAPEAVKPVPHGTERILVVDDEQSVRTAGQRILRALGYQVQLASCGEEALALLRANPAAFDLLLTDQTMPRGTGLALAAEARTLRPDLRVVLMTGFSEAVQGRSAADMGIHGVVAKPFSIADLAAAVRDALA